MAKVPRKSSDKKKIIMSNPKPISRKEFESHSKQDRIKLIKELIPIGLMVVAEELQREIDELVETSGKDAEGRPKVLRYGYNDGSVILDHRRIPIKVPRIRGEKGEIQLKSYDLLHSDHDSDSIYNTVLKGVSCRDFESTKKSHDGSIGVSKSTISRQFSKTTQKKLEIFQKRPLNDYDFVAIFLDGKYFASDQMVIALGITADGKKIALGFVQTATENAQSVGLFLRSLLDRGLNVDQGVLAIIDGSKGLSRALKDVFKGRVVIQRCQWHKRENVLSYLSKTEQPQIKALLQSAYERTDYLKAKEALQSLLQALNRMNQSASGSLTEGLEETLTLHRLGVFGILGKSFKTTNCIESLNSAAGDFCSNVRKWSNSSQKCRWLAAALMEIEPSFRRIKNHSELSQLRFALKKDLGIQ